MLGYWSLFLRILSLLCSPVTIVLERYFLFNLCGMNSSCGLITSLCIQSCTRKKAHIENGFNMLLAHNCAFPQKVNIYILVNIFLIHIYENHLT